ncbi:FK506-binding protein 15-like isoform X2 [Arapaima gigas]
MAKVWDTTDYLWREAPATKLASLFRADETVSQSNQSFQYKAPRTPRGSSACPASQKQTLASPTSVPAVLSAMAVHAFKYVNGEHRKLGRIGAAVLGNLVTREYKILLYYNQQEHLTSATVHPGFVFTVQPGNYGSFYDDHRQNWSVMFETEKARADFCKEVKRCFQEPFSHHISSNLNTNFLIQTQVCLAKRNSTPFQEAVVVQDLVLGEGHPAETGDTVEVNYTGWLLQNHSVGQMIDSTVRTNKPLQLRIGAGKVIKGLEEGVFGSRKGGRRFLVVPPSLGYGSQGILNQVPANSTLVFEVEICQVKPAKEKGLNLNSVGRQCHESVSSPPNMSTQLPTTIPSEQEYAHLPHQPSVLGLQYPDATKAKLMSHVARVGQPKLPFLMETILAPPNHNGLDPLTTTGCTGSSVETTQQLPANSVLQQGKGSPFCHQCTAATDVTSFLMTEARQHSTEIRLVVGKVGDKVDLLASKVDELQKQWCFPLGVCPVTMETVTLLHNIQRIIQENAALKEEVSKKSSSIQEQNIKIRELINQVQRQAMCMEENNLLLEQRNDSVQSANEQNQARLLQAEQEKVQLAEELASSSSRLSQLQLEVMSHQQRVKELQLGLSNALQDNEKCVTRITSLETQVTELMEELELMRVQHRAERQSCKEAELKACRLEDDLQDLRMDKEQLEQTLADRNWKWQEEHQRFAEELEEVRQSCLLKGVWQDMQSGSNQNGSGSVPPQFSSLRQSNHVNKPWFSLQQPQKELQGLTDTVKHVVNSVFHVLKGQFEFQGMYSGQALLGTIRNTMRTVTMQLLDDIGLASSERAEDDVKDTEEENEPKSPKEDQQYAKEQELPEDASKETPEELQSRERGGKEENMEEGEQMEVADDCKQVTKVRNCQLKERRAHELQVSLEEDSVQKLRFSENTDGTSRQDVESLTQSELNEPGGEPRPSKMEYCPDGGKEQDTEPTQSKSGSIPDGRLEKEDQESGLTRSSDSTEGELKQWYAGSTQSKVEECWVKEPGSKSAQSNFRDCTEGGFKEQGTSNPPQSEESTEGRPMEQRGASSQSGPDQSTEGEIMEHKAISAQLGPEESTEGGVIEDRAVSS